MDKYIEAERKMREAGEANIELLEIMDVLNMEFITGRNQANRFKKMLEDQLKDLQRCMTPEDFYYIMNRRSD